jgi:quinol monooxygenase YgiN
MTVLVHAEIHGLAGRAPELRGLLTEHARTMSEAAGNLGSAAYEPIGGEAGEFVLDARWRDEDALHAHYATPGYSRYMELVGELLARPSDVEIHHVERSVRATGDRSLDPRRHGWATRALRSAGACRSDAAQAAEDPSIAPTYSSNAVSEPQPMKAVGGRGAAGSRGHCSGRSLGDSHRG